MPLMIRVPLPPRALSPNGGTAKHWRVVAGPRADYRRDCAWWMRKAVTEACWEAPGRAVVSMVWCTSGARRAQLYGPQDVPNAVSAFKAGFDALVDAGALLDDTWRRMALGRVEIDPGRGPWVDVVVDVVEMAGRLL